ncbi:beta strand repeat-containing protein, partial [Saccharothrix sp. Mg75]|uniref:beta strand repeat-containing protein n=1 Tax=Saccharothrix sp. Mg75 TaxID=3445357 RepID=UPI003EEACEC2
MLGTGIASAQENVNPDAPPNPLDAKVRVPVDVDHNNLGTPVGNRDLPTVHREIGTPSVSGTPAGRIAAPANPLLRAVQERVQDVQERVQGVETAGITRGNTADADVVVPVGVCGNAVAAGGDAYTEGDCAKSVDSTGDIRTDGSYGAFSGNVASLAAAVSPQVSGNAVAGLANAETRSTTAQDATAGGDVTTSGRHGSLSGNVAAAQAAAPVQVTNNAFAAGGNSHSRSAASNDAAAPGVLRTSGDRGTAGGNVLGAPLAPVVAVSGNGVGAAGNADAQAENSASAKAGDTEVEQGYEKWSTTSGNDGTLAGNVVQPSLAGPVSGANNAFAGVGNSDVTSSSANRSEAGGNSVSSAQDGVLSGNFADVPIALPTSGAGNSLAGVGNSSSRHANDAEATAGGDTYTDGDRSVLSANSANLPPAGAVDLCGNSLAGGGIAGSECDNEVTADAGGRNGSTGNDAVGSGNIGQVPIGAPAEAFGNGVGAAGSSAGNSSERKTIRSGAVADSHDDNGTVSSNVISAPTAAGGQVFGNSGGAVANPTSRTDSDTEIDLGNPPKANGKHGSASGNIVHVPTSNPAQVFGDSVVGVGNGSSDTTNKLDSRSGGTAVTTGDEGSLSGNVLSVPEASSPQVFGSAIGAGSNVDSESRNEFGSFSGGDVYTSGDDASLSGNGVGAQPTVPLQVFGDAASVAGNGRSDVDSGSDLAAGGRHLTSAEDSSWSGNLLTAPLGAEPAVHGDSVSALGIAKTTTDSVVESRSGGTTDTSGRGSGSAHDLELPGRAAARFFGVPLDVMGQAETSTTDRSRVLTGEQRHETARSAEQGVQLPVGVDSLMGATELPNLDVLALLSDSRWALRASTPHELRGLLVQGVSKIGPARDVPAVKTRVPRTELPTDQLSAVTRELPRVVEVLPGTADERSFAGQLPVSGDVLGLDETRELPALVETLPVGATLPGAGRSMPTLPVAAPIALPFVVPVPGVAQPRTTTPALPPASLSGLDVNPLQDVALPGLPRVERTQAPALAGLDALTVFGALEDTTVLP